MTKRFLALALCLSLAALSACTASSGRYQTSEVDMVDSTERHHLSTEITLGDIIAFAENLTNKMLQSPAFTKAKKEPRIIVADLVQNTHDENLRISDIQDRIMEVLYGSGQVRVMDRSANNFDYIMKSEISSIVTRSPKGQKLVSYSMKIKLYTITGELRGQWSDDLSLFKK